MTTSDSQAARERKLAFHLEMIVWSDLPEGTRLEARQVGELMEQATAGQKQRAYERALTHSPILLGDER